MKQVAHAVKLSRMVLVFVIAAILAFPAQVRAATIADASARSQTGDSFVTPNSQPDTTKSLNGLTYSISHCGNTGSRVLLTYDDWSYNDPPRIVTQAKLLRSKGVGGMFFPIREYYYKYLQKYGVNLPEKVRAEGQYTSNHTWSHPDLTKLSSYNIDFQIAHGLGGRTGSSGYLRPPYGAYNSTVKSIAEGMNYHVCTWTVDTRDWEGKSASSICSYVKTYVQPGSVILMHLQTNSYYATSCIVDGIRAKGLQLCRPYTVNNVVSPTSLRAPYPLPC